MPGEPEAGPDQLEREEDLGPEEDQRP